MMNFLEMEYGFLVDVVSGEYLAEVFSNLSKDYISYYKLEENDNTLSFKN